MTRFQNADNRLVSSRKINVNTIDRRSSKSIFYVEIISKYANLQNCNIVKRLHAAHVTQFHNSYMKQFRFSLI